MILETGYGNFVMGEKVVAVSEYGSAPSIRAIKRAKDEGKLIDHTEGRKTRSVIAVNDGFIIASSRQVEVLKKQIEGKEVA